MKFNLHRTATMGSTVLLSAGLTCLTGLPTLSADSTTPTGGSKSQQEKELGIPIPQQSGDTEDTRKKRDPNKAQSPDSNRQVTVGGAQGTLEGEILTVDGQNFDIKTDPAGDRVRVVVNQDTNMDCAKSPRSGDRKQSDTLSSDRVPMDKQGATSGSQMAQGQRNDETARGSGFKIGSCDFKQGDRIKAEVDDMGRVTTLKYVASAMHH
ncbi:hypothetical protein W02_32050 [Nitrospira sp. KM1]|uniref:hypothetical protein n=1 Tax=Nitrospira sp. KM1 TaxID=1936990 RepID=UPI0013A7105E|nr:hypothetical protein [Nitrospira sp. KM1]BCA56065.1 hypothetical protein W02_32050 [Nitrospira sp. KM1]